jgi:hypothetical protein
LCPAGNTRYYHSTITVTVHAEHGDGTRSCARLHEAAPAAPRRPGAHLRSGDDPRACQHGYTVSPGTLYPLLHSLAHGGSFLGARLLKKVTLRAVQLVVAIGLIGIGLAMIAGLV